jgi:pilus assembly protein CpaE
MTELNKSTNGGPDKKGLSVALVSPDEPWRVGAATLLTARANVRCHEITHFQSDPRDFAPALAQKFDAVLLDVDCDPDFMLQLAEALGKDGSTYVMAASSQQDMKLAVRFMRAGVREFFTLPVDPNEVVAALNRAADRPVQASSKPIGKLYVFIGTKGGVGVTTLAANFALTLAQESEKKSLIVDFGLPLGDLAINLGIRTQYSVINALGDPSRLDGNLLETIVTKHESGLAVLGAPAEFPALQPTTEAFDKLVTIARTNYDFVIVDVGSRVDLFSTALFEQCTTVYLVTQVGITELRNAHRMITQFFAARGRSLQIILNRYTQRALLFDDGQITKTLTREADWKVPDDYAAARRTRDTATPLALVDSALSSTIRELVRKAAEIPAEVPKKSFFRLRR